MGHEKEPINKKKPALSLSLWFISEGYDYWSTVKLQTEKWKASCCNYHVSKTDFTVLFQPPINICLLTILRCWDETVVKMISPRGRMQNGFICYFFSIALRTLWLPPLDLQVLDSLLSFIDWFLDPTPGQINFNTCFRAELSPLTHILTGLYTSLFTCVVNAISFILHAQFDMKKMNTTVVFFSPSLLCWLTMAL